MKKDSFLPKFFALSTIIVATLSVAGAQSLLPEVFNDIFDKDVVAVAFNRIQMFFLLLLGGFLVLVVFYIIRGLQKFASKDSAGDMSEATNIMQRNMIAIGGVFIGVIGVAVVLIFFGINPNQIVPHQICVSNSKSYGCYSCTQNPSSASLKETFADICSVCDQKDDASFGVTEPNTDVGTVNCLTTISDGQTKDDIEEVLKGANIEQ